MQTHRFTFNYDGEKDFELRAKSKTDRDEWVEAIEFLIEIREKLGNMVDERSVSVSTYFSVDTPIVEKTDEGSSKSKGSSKSYKYANLGKDEVMGIMDDENDQFHNIDKQLSNQKKQSEQILIETGIWDYISQIPDNKRNWRVQYGFLGKPTRNALKIEKSRWLFLISSRPLTQDAYLQDNDEITEDDLPILIKFDTIYYYSVGFNNKDAELKGEIKTIDIDSVHINNENNGIHSFVIDAKSKKYEFVSKKRFYIEQWIDAIELSAKTAKEKQYSITGKIRNISMIITSYEMDRDELRERVERDTELMLWDEVTNNYKEFDEIHNLLLLLSEIKEEMIYIFDACMVQKPPRKDIIELYMETTHIKLWERLTYEWNEKALLMGLLDIFALLEWIFEYMTTLNKFGIKDDSIDNGYLILWGAYKRKIHMQIYPMITNVLIREREAEVEESESGVLYTHSPADIFKIFNEVFEILTKKPMKEMILGVLEILHQVFTQYQRALYQMINMDQTLSVDYLIALNNNFSRYFDFIELLLSPLKRNENITETEIEKSFDQREIQQLFSKITLKIVERIGEETWILAAPLYQINYIDLDIEQILYKSMQIFDEKIKLMNKQTSREVWKVYLKKTVIAYVQLMLNSTMSIKKSKGTSLIQGKIQKDYEQISDMFSEWMTKRLLKAGLEVLTDLTNFFEASVDFLPISVGKMRKEHGPSFNLTTIKALLSLRTDLDKQEKTAILKEWKEILNEYKNEKSISHSGIFNWVNTAEAVKEFNDEMKDPEEEKTKGKGKKEVKAEEVEEEEDEFNLDDFLKEGGINVEDLEEKPTGNLDVY